MTAIDDYIAAFPAEQRARLEQVRDAVRQELPEADEVLSYAIPTFDLHGKHIVHFAAFKGHIGFYPTPSGVEAFREELAAFFASTSCAASRGTGATRSKQSTRRAASAELSPGASG